MFVWKEQVINDSSRVYVLTEEEVSMEESIEIRNLLHQYIYDELKDFSNDRYSLKTKYKKVRYRAEELLKERGYLTLESLIIGHFINV